MDSGFSFLILKIINHTPSQNTFSGMWRDEVKWTCAIRRGLSIERCESAKGGRVEPLRERGLFRNEQREATGTETVASCWTPAMNCCPLVFECRSAMGIADKSIHMG